ncbi:MAG TPA: MFS transporter [Pseudolysinimonas sp.]
MAREPATGNSLSAWQVVIGFGVVSLGVDLVADGARSIAGPLLGQLGASALVVALVTGAAEALGFGLRLFSGPAVDRTRRYWAFSIGGYTLTALCVPLLAITPFLGTIGLAVAASLIIVERVGKAIRSPAKTTLLAPAAGAVGRGRGFGVHKLFDQIGAFGGPLLVAAIVAMTGALWPALAFLALPAIVALLILLWLRRRVPDPDAYEPAAAGKVTRTGDAATDSGASRPAGRLSRNFILFAASTTLTTFGLVGFGLISFHLTTAGLVPLPTVPLVYALGMAVAAVAAIVTGRLYDRIGPVVLLVVPVLAAAVPFLSLAPALPAVLGGVAVWGAATGIQDSTVKALVADLVPLRRRGGAYGIFAVFQGAGTFAGAAIAGALYPDAALLGVLVAPAQLVALGLLVVVVRRHRRRTLTADTI